MHPVLIDLPALHIHVLWNDVLTVGGVLACILIAPYWAERSEGLDRRAVRRALLFLGLIALVGGRLHFLLNHAALYAERPLDALRLWSGGFHIGGGLLAIALAMPWVTRRNGLPLGRFADAIIPGIGLAIVMARTGCLLHGCCFGQVTEHPWGIHFPFDSSVHRYHIETERLAADALQSLPVHPLQIYFAAIGLLLIVGAIGLRPRRAYPGQIALLALVVFSSSTVMLERFREIYGASPRWGAFTQLEWMDRTCAHDRFRDRTRHGRDSPSPGIAPDRRAARRTTGVTA
jgi:phosphatidylglycerol:prolipoprotein diacylglycerol transferase